MKVEGTDVGKVIKTIRKKKNMSIMELSEAAGISKSHLEKIEAGLRRPGISTYQKLLHLLGSELVTCVVEDTVQQQYAIRAEEIFLKSSEAQAEYLIKVLECMAENIQVLS